MIAVDIQQEMLDTHPRAGEEAEGDERRAGAGHETDPKLPAGAVDLILMVDVYHEFALPFEMTEEMVKALKPGGRLVFVEFRLEDEKVPIKLVHKMSERQVHQGDGGVHGAGARQDVGHAAVAARHHLHQEGAEEVTGPGYPGRRWGMILPSSIRRFSRSYGVCGHPAARRPRIAPAGVGWASRTAVQSFSIDGSHRPDMRPRPIPWAIGRSGMMRSVP